MKQWYLLNYKYGQIKRVQAGLLRIGVISFSPNLAVTKPRKDSASLRTCYEPLFPCYLFAYLDVCENHTSQVSATPGINYFVRFGGVPRPIPTETIEKIRDNGIGIEKLRILQTTQDKTLRVAMLLEYINSLPAEVNAVNTSVLNLHAA